jgi:hypothetical protein
MICLGNASNYRMRRIESLAVGIHPTSPPIAMAALDAKPLLTRETIHPPLAPQLCGWAASLE